MKAPTSHSNRQRAWRQFRQNTPAMVAMVFLTLLTGMALLAPYLANHRPLYAVVGDARIWPAFHPDKTYTLTMADGQTLRLQNDITDWRKVPMERVVWPVITYSPGVNDYNNTGFVAPNDPQFMVDAAGKTVPLSGRLKHQLGTNNTGKDVAAGLIHGARYSLSIGFVAMGIAGFLGILLGAMAGYFGDRQLAMRRGQWLMLVPGLLLGWMYGFYVRRYLLADAAATSPIAGALQLCWSVLIAAGILLLALWAGKWLSRMRFLHHRHFIPVDSLVSRTIEVVHSLPVFILIITVAAITRPSLLHVMVIIGLTSWTSIARLTRAEFLKIRQLDYISAANALGFSSMRIILRHALPNAIAPALVSIAFGIAAAILIESSLSFLGVGVPPGTVTWGSMVNEGRQQFSAWWLVVFPGLLIFTTVTAYNLIGEGLRDAFDPRLGETTS
ncbi:MAG: hypothetical protein ABR94_06495 [Sphingobacteriales bacterium BACL12 MAG-120802-bin5]|jgi:peptide/nickel transport system permease protein|nr:MAG: hypothetical protein ABR94_06495 [Sphingobacteriales bacterium BACL12 MAG-120802-bin5]